MGKSSRENWADVRGYEGLYQVSDKGNIRRVIQNRTRILKQYVSKANGYCYINLYKNNKSSTMRVHKIVAREFLGEPPQNKLQINHIDGNKANNAVENLEYCDQSENMRHAYMTGLEKPKGLRAICLDDMKIYDTLTDAARAVSGGTAQGEMVARVCRGERSHYRGFHFAFYDDFVNGTIPPYKGKSKRKESKSLWR